MTRAIFVIGLALIIAGAVRPAAQVRPESTLPRSAPSTTPKPFALPGARVVPGTRNVPPTIHGNAVTSSDAALANTTVRLRDARLGRVVNTQITDPDGHFSFTTIDPGSYVVELMGRDRTTVVAASDIINVNAGDVATAVVKLPVRLPPLAALAGGGPSALAIAAEAAAAGILATTVVGTASSDRPIR